MRQYLYSYGELIVVRNSTGSGGYFIDIIAAEPDGSVWRRCVSDKEDEEIGLCEAEDDVGARPAAIRRFLDREVENQQKYVEAEQRELIKLVAMRAEIRGGG
jgi:hypothetical protein